MHPADQYRRFASDCRRLAAMLTKPVNKQALELMATGWDGAGHTWSMCSAGQSRQIIWEEIAGRAGRTDLKQSIGFYSALFGTEPSAIKTDYAKWMLDDPRVNFFISTRGRQVGLDHLGIQAGNGDELKEIYSRLHKAGGNITKPKNLGLSTHQVSRGKHSIRRAKARTTATAAANGSPESHMRMLRAINCITCFSSATGNSVRSILAEAILNKVGAGKFRAYSTGSQPKGRVHPETIRLLQNLGYDTSSFRSKSWNELLKLSAPQFDFAFTVYDNTADEIFPVWPGQPMTAHWGVPNPTR